MEYFDPESGFGTVHGAATPAYEPTSVTPGFTPAAPAASAAPQVQTMAGYTPDYESLIRSSPSFLAASNATTMNNEQAAAQRRARLRQAYVRYGGDLPA